jgi:flavin reductase (DIM6/NTAB) family NADH-FMN oxidoreductase RutF
MRKEIEPFSVVNETVSRMINDDGMLLVAGEKPNPMTIAWATIGIIWKMPVLMVFVRASRYTHKCMEEIPYFSVNIPDDDLAKQVALCGSKSGRDVNKIEECGFIMEKGIRIPVPYIKQSVCHYECRTIFKNAITDSCLENDIKQDYYGSGDYHTVYYGKILGVYNR